ncbi:MAG: hypothetical protein LBP30_07020 [Clostridiales Family XIII bacterium]|jgi:hypothetical protein|nr:hypothetical protein [Clostridiales Family XIII bacterium]
MKIDAYSIQAASNRRFCSEDIQIRSVKQEKFRVSIPVAPERAVSLDLSPDANRLIQNLRAKTENVRVRAEDAGARAGSVSACDVSPKKYSLALHRSILEALLYKLTGKKFAFRAISFKLGASRETPSLESAANAASAADAVSADKAASAANAPAGGGSSQKQVTVTEEAFFSSHYESESLRYEAKGLVKTADGREISIDIGLSMSRESYASVRGVFVNEEVRNVDPLVLNFSGTAASFTERKFEFDLDADGRLDSIGFAGEGSGFLALDKNEDGVINDGAELFGPSSGSGFGELRAYDADGNGWIDENDDVFSKLRVWSKDADGADMLFTLKEADVGAIFLNDVSTQYTLGEAGATGGTMRATSVFLKESGGAGLISHIDLAV